MTRILAFIKINLLFITCCVAISLSSCSHVYTPALYHEDIAYQPKPTSFDTSKSLTYITGGIGVNSSNNFSDDKISGELDISRGHAFKNVNLSYGAFGVYGDYANSAIQKDEANYFTDKFYGAVGGRASVNLFATSGKTDFRFIGVEAAYSHEFGAYPDYRKFLNDQHNPDYYIDTRTNLFTIGLSSEVIFHKDNDKTFQQGIRGFIGGTTGHNPLNDTYYNEDSNRDQFFHNVTLRASYFITFKNFIGIGEVGDGISVRFGYKF